MNNRAWNATSRLSKATRTRCASELDEPQGVGSIRAALEQDLSGQRASQAVQDVMRSRRLRQHHHPMAGARCSSGQSKALPKSRVRWSLARLRVAAPRVGQARDVSGARHAQSEETGSRVGLTLALDTQHDVVFQRGCWGRCSCICSTYNSRSTRASMIGWFAELPRCDPLAQR